MRKIQTLLGLGILLIGGSVTISLLLIYPFPYYFIEAIVVGGITLMIGTLLLTRKLRKFSDSEINNTVNSVFVSDDISNNDNVFCENCGNTLNPTAKFCGKCGTPVS